jgi:hypothetical protein
MNKRIRAIKKDLTKLYKKSIIYLNSLALVLRNPKKFRESKQDATRSSPFSLFIFRRIAMKNFMQQRGHLVAVLGIVLVTASLVACGGGGGGGSTPVTPPASFTETVTCPTGEQKSATASTQSAAIDAAGALCPAPTLLSVTPANGDTTTSPDTLVGTGIVVATSSALRVPNVADVTLKAGTLNVPGTITLVGTKGFKFTPTAKLAYGQAYTFVANLFDGLGKSLVVQSTFTTSAVVCTAPAMLNSAGTCISPPAATGYTWNSVIKVWVADIGTLVTGLNALPAECVTVGDACWKESSASGKIKYFATNMVLTGINDRKMVFAGFIVGKSGPASGYFNTIPIYIDTEADTPFINKDIGASWNSDGFVNGKGSQEGLKFTTPTNGCWEKFFTGTGTNSRSVSCPI